MKILVTGGAGFVGSNLVSSLVELGHSVVAVDDMSNGRLENQISGAEYFEEDLINYDSLEKLSKFKWDCVLHLAAQSSNATSFKNPMRDLGSNLISTQNILRFCSANKVRRLIFTSSMSVYGSPTRLPTPTSEIPQPKTYYAIHKAASEQYVQISKDLDWTIFRLYTTYGFGQNLFNLEQGLVKIFLGYILRDKTIEVHGSGQRIRDIVHVSDVVDAIIMSLSNRESFGKILNLGYGKTLTVDEIIGHLLSNLGKSQDYPIKYLDADQGDPIATHSDISETTRILGWLPKISPEQGLKMTASRYREEMKLNPENK